MIRPRTKPRRGEVIDPKFLDWCSQQPCCITGRWPATTHHVRSYGSLKNDRRVIRLVVELHMHGFGMNCIERLGKAKFEKFHGVSIEAEITKLNERYEREQN